jgi:hypothetical protein
MQLLLTYSSAPADWDASSEDRSLAGLTQLQVWRDADGGATVVLLEVNDRAKAEAWLAKERGLGASIDARFLKTA